MYDGIPYVYCCGIDAQQNMRLETLVHRQLRSLLTCLYMCQVHPGVNIRPPAAGTAGRVHESVQGGTPAILEDALRTEIDWLTYPLRVLAVKYTLVGNLNFLLKHRFLWAVEYKVGKLSSSWETQMRKDLINQSIPGRSEQSSSVIRAETNYQTREVQGYFLEFSNLISSMHLDMFNPWWY